MQKKTVGDNKDGYSTAGQVQVVREVLWMFTVGQNEMKANRTIQMQKASDSCMRSSNGSTILNPILLTFEYTAVLKLAVNAL